MTMNGKENPKGVIYMPYIPFTTSTTINNVKVWDYRWYVNILCKINWFFHFKKRRRWNEIKDTKTTVNYAK